MTQKILEEFESKVTIDDVCSAVRIGLGGLDVQLYWGQLLFRVVRPGKPDYNPYHKDTYLDYCHDLVNIFVPVAGCTKETSLRIVPSSHLWPEDRIKRTPKGGDFNGKKFNVPCIVSYKGNQLPVIPNPDREKGEFLIFTPYAIHGKSSNESAQTRVSIEARFRRRSPQLSVLPKLPALLPIGTRVARQTDDLPRVTSGDWSDLTERLGRRSSALGSTLYLRADVAKELLLCIAVAMAYVVGLLAKCPEGVPHPLRRNSDRFKR